MQDASGLLKEALDLLRQYNAAPALQLEIQTAYEVRAYDSASARSCHKLCVASAQNISTHWRSVVP